MNASDTYFDLDDYEVQQSLALSLFDDFADAYAQQFDDCEGSI